jgi:hypothetical protein
MGLPRRFKDVIRRLAVALFALFEILGLPRIPEKGDAERGGSK